MAHDDLSFCSVLFIELSRHETITSTRTFACEAKVLNRNIPIALTMKQVTRHKQTFIYRHIPAFGHCDVAL